MVTVKLVNTTNLSTQMVQTEAATLAGFLNQLKENDILDDELASKVTFFLKDSHGIRELGPSSPLSNEAEIKIYMSPKKVDSGVK